ncbi:hypothetical protein Bpfe_011535 [Biomphalaria pfeifferi]|uniref:Uncharacterized protein n=1 Tax=Biomphalaria pfeifferi TaxID=112525 RepID=A0AAD8FC49_BIOPF|nr:hypothetical protein Bpfe_011535 [Biomphalaria pfeifferi]
MALEREAVGLIATSCVLIFLLLVACILASYVCYRRLENNKLTKLPRYGPGDVSAWASGVSRSTVTDVDADFNYSNRIHAYQPKILIYPKESYQWERKYKRRRSSKYQDSITQIVQDGRTVSVINISNNGQDTTIRKSSGNDELVAGHKMTKPSGQYVYGHASTHKREPSPEHVIHETDGKVVRCYVIEEDVDVATGHHNDRDLQVSVEDNKFLYRVPPVTQGFVDHPEIVRSHTIKQQVTLGEGGKLVIADSQEVDLNESSNFVVSSQKGSQDIYGLYSTGQDDRSSRVHAVHSSPLTDAGHPSRFSAHGQSPTSTSLHRVNAAVPQIIICHSSETQASGSDQSDDEEYDRKRKENYKVIKKHSAHKIPDMIIKKVIESDTHLDPETKDTMTQLEQRIGSGHDHRESISEIQRRLSNFSNYTDYAHTLDTPARQSAVTFGEVTHIQDAQYMGGEDYDEDTMSHRDKIFSDFDATIVPTTTKKETYTSPDGTKTTTVQRVSHVVEVDYGQPSSSTATPAESTFSGISQQIHQFRELTDGGTDFNG